MKTLVDPESRGRIRKASVVPITPCCSALSEFGRNDATTAMMRALNKLPKKWQLEIEQEANRANLETDLVLDAQLEEMDADGCDEHAEVTILHELIVDLYAALLALEEKTCADCRPSACAVSRTRKSRRTIRRLASLRRFAQH